MRETCVEFVDHEVLVYFPGTTKVATTKPSLEEALAFAREEWPDFGIRVIITKDLLGILAQVPSQCFHCC